METFQSSGTMTAPAISTTNMRLRQYLPIAQDDQSLREEPTLTAVQQTRMEDRANVLQ